MKMLNVMVDIETLSTAPDAAIISLGAVEFDPQTPFHTGDEFYVTFDWQDVIRRGLHVEASTIEWWMSQSSAARDALTRKKNERHKLVSALGLFNIWLKDAGVKDDNFRLWCHGLNFDEPVLHSAYRSVSMERPWKYNCVRDDRTLFEVIGIWPNGEHYPSLTAHHALCDAKRQCYDVQKAFAYRGSSSSRNLPSVESFDTVWRNSI